jgi:N-acetylneuraminic acid mutarotase
MKFKISKYIYFNICCLKNSILFALLMYLLSTQTLISQNTWTAKTDFPGAGRSSSVSFAIGNKGYNLFGSHWGVDTWEYDMTTDIWTQLSDFPDVNAGRVSASSFVIGNLGYITGGEGAPYFNDLWEFNPSGNTWTQKTNYAGLATPETVSFSIGNKGYTGLGHAGGLPYYNDYWEYDSQAETWTQIANYGGAARVNAFAFTLNGKAYVGGGFDNVNYYQDVWEYTPSTNQWVQKSNFGGGIRAESQSFVIGDKGYVCAGTSDGSTPQSDLWMYNPSNDTWTRKLDFPGTLSYGLWFSRVIANTFVFSSSTKGYIGPEMYEYSPSIAPTITSTTEATNISYSSVSLGGIVASDGNDTITSRGIVYSLSMNPTLSDFSVSVVGSLGSFTTSLTGLYSNTTYYVRGFATNAFGTSYGPQETFTTLKNPEDLAPNSGDSNNDGIPDSQQNEVYSILNTYTNKYLTIVSLDGYTITGAEVQAPNDNINYYPGSLVKFTIAHSSARVKIYYHGVTSLNGYSFKKLNSQNILFNFTNYTFGSEVIDGKTVATATLTLTDGGPEDYDGVVNGSITDPGGPAILASNANIPVWDWRYVLMLMSLFGFWIYKNKIS